MFFKLLTISLFSFCLCAPKEEKVLNGIPLQKIRQTKSKNPSKVLIITSGGKLGGNISLTQGIVSYLQNNCEIDIFDVPNLARGSEKGGFDYYGVMQKSLVMISLTHTFCHIAHNIFSKLPERLMNMFFKLEEFEVELIKNKYDLVIFNTTAHPIQVNKKCIKQKIPCITLIADYGEPRVPKSFWIREEGAVYLAAKNSYFKSAEKYPSFKYISGIPVRKEFKIVREKSKQEVKIKLGLDPKVPCILVFFGAGGSDEMYDIAQVCKDDKTKKYVFLCALHTKLKTRIDQMKCPHFITCGYINNPSEYIRAADVLVSKPGGVLITEAISCETPCIFKNSHFFSVSPIEKPTLRYVEDNEYGMSISSYDELLPALDEVIKKRIVFPKNNGLDESVTIIRRMLKERRKWARRFFA